MKKHFLLLLAASLTLLSCGDTSEGEPIKDNTRTGIDNALSYSQDYAGKRVSMTGYLAFDDGASYEEGKNLIRMSFHSGPGGEGDLLQTFEVKMGDGKNEVSIPKGKEAAFTPGYKTTSFEVDPSKISVTTAGGARAPLTQKLKVSGTVEYTKDFNTGKTMEMPMFNSDKKGYVYELKDVRFDEVK